jgi:hypothetical protein
VAQFEILIVFHSPWVASSRAKLFFKRSEGSPLKGLCATGDPSARW